jgi:hypothetical protein
MTEAEWLACEDPTPMLRALCGTASERKLRLFACACCRRIWLVAPPVARAAVDVAERYADRNYSSEQVPIRLLEEAAEAIEADRSLKPWEDIPTRNAAQNTLYEFSAEMAAHWAANSSPAGPGRRRRRGRGVQISPQGELTAQAHLLCDIFGNPFRPVTFDPAWRSDTALTLARGMYESRDFSPMPILADALQDAGCDNADILNHCRGTGPHVRGCWVVDLVLGKE